VPHVPTSITNLNQTFPIRFGKYQLYLAINRNSGSTEISSVQLNNSPWPQFNATTVTFPYASLPSTTDLSILISFGTTTSSPKKADESMAEIRKKTDNKSATTASQREAIFNCTLSQQIINNANNMSTFVTRMNGASLGSRYETAHANLVLSFTNATVTRYPSPPKIRRDHV